MNLNDLAQRELERTKSLKGKMESLVVDMGPGSLIGKIRTDGNYQFYRYTNENGDGKLFYLNRDFQDVVRQYLQNRFALDSMKRLDMNQKGLEAFIRAYREYDPNEIIKGFSKTYSYAWDFCEKRGLLVGNDQGAIRFKSSEKTDDADELKISTSFGLKVRSKGEALIAEALYYNTDEIFCYEKELQLTDEFGRSVKVYPDFTILQKTGGTIYWEHKGMMGDAGYVRKDQRKMELYFRNDIHAPKNLIITCDGPDGSLDMQAVMKLIQGYFGKTFIQ